MVISLGLKHRSFIGSTSMVQCIMCINTKLMDFRMYILSCQVGCKCPGYGFYIFVYIYYDPRESFPILTFALETTFVKQATVL
jgi:hypothetical protein